MRVYYPYIYVICVPNKLVRRVWLIQKGRNILEKVNDKMLNEITELVNQTKSNRDYVMDYVKVNVKKWFPKLVEL